jgi:hypothetical protein
MRKFRFPFELILAAAIIAANLYAVFVPANSLMNWYTTDDAFYYFKTAQNFTQGLDLSFDGISRSSGFHPLWMAVCIPVFALARFDLILPLRIIVLISILLAAGSGIYFYKLLSSVISKPAAMLLSLFWAFEPRVQATVTQLGMEAGINAFFILLLLYQTYRYEVDFDTDHDDFRRLFWVGLTATLAVLSRLDNVFIVAMIGIWLILRRPSLRSMMIIDPVLIAISVFVSYFLRVGFQINYQPYIDSATIMVIAALVIKMTTFYIAGLYGRNKSSYLRMDLLRIIGAASIGSLLTGGLMILLSALKLFGSFPRTVIFSDWILSLLFILIFRWIIAYSKKWTGLLPVFEGEGLLRQNWKRWLQLSLSYFSPIAVTMFLYMGIYKLYFGTFSPVSGQVKHWWGSIITVYGRPTASMLEFFGFTPQFDHSPWSLALVFVADAAKNTLSLLNLNPKDTTLNANASLIYSLIFGGIILTIIFLNWKRFSQMAGKFPILPLFAGCMAQIINYSGTNYVNTRGWYWIGEMIFIVIIFALLVDVVINLLVERLHINGRVIQTIVILLGMVMIVHYDALLLHQISPTVTAQKANNYLLGIKELEKVTEPGSIIGSTGGGVIAYFIQDRTIVNMDGLMNSTEYFQLMEKHDASSYFNRIKLNYVYANPVIIDLSEPYIWLIKDQLTPLGAYGGSTLFRYTPKSAK